MQILRSVGWFGHACFALSLLLSLALPARAQMPDSQSRIANAFELGDAAALQSLLDKTGASDLERIFFTGLLLRRQNRHQEAAELFRQVLIVAPGFRPMREALIQSLVELEEYEGAIFHLDELIETEPNDDLRRQYQNLRTQILARRPYGFSFGLSIVPSSNVNRATGTETVELGGLPFRLSTTEQSGVGLTLSLGAFRRASLSEGAHLQFNLDASVTAFDNPDFNRGSLGGQLRYTKRSESGAWTFAAGATRNVYSEQVNDHTRYHVSGRRDWVQDRRLIWGFALGASRKDFSAAQNDGFDAYRVQASADMRRRLGDHTILGASFGLGYETTNDPRFEFASYSFGLSATRAWQNGWQVGIATEYEHRPYENAFGGFFPYRREDNVYGVKVSASNRSFRFGNMVPGASCSATHIASNVPIYDDRDIFECAFSLTQRF